jgi:hypothetical protein
MLLGETPATYTYEEYTDLVFVYGFCNGNRSAAVEGNIGSNIHIT